MKRYSTSPWVSVMAAAVAALAATWLTDSLVTALFIAVVVALFFGGAVAIMRRRRASRDA